MAGHVFDVDLQAVALAAELLALVGHAAHDAADQAVEGLVLVGGQLDAQLFGHLFQVGGAAYLPAVPVQLANLHLADGVLVVHVAHQLFHQVVDGDDAAHPAVLVDDDGEILALLLHPAEQLVRPDALGHEEGLIHRVFHHRLAGQIVQPEVVLGVQHAHHVVLALAADGEVSIVAVPDGAGPDAHVVLQVQADHVAPAGADLLGGGIVHIKNVLDDLVLVVFDGALLAALHQHHLDLVLGDHFLVLVGVDAQQPQQSVGGHGQQPDQRRAQLGHEVQDAGQLQRQGLGLFHGQALGHQLAEHDAEIGQHQRDEEHHRRVQGRAGRGHPQREDQVHDGVGEVFGRKGAAQQAGQGDGHLDGGQELGGLFGQVQQPAGPLVALLREDLQPGLAHRDHRDLRAGEQRVDRDQNNLDDKCAYHNKQFSILIA